MGRDSFWRSAIGRYSPAATAADNRRSDGRQSWGEFAAVVRPSLWQDCSVEQRLALRQQFSAPILIEYKAWLDCHLVQTAPKTLLGKAIRYTLRLWPQLTRFLEDGRLVLSNNETEQAIKRFAATPAGAHALANLYSLVETAKANGQEPWAYLKQVFTALPAAVELEQIEALLPWQAVEGEATPR